MTLVEMLHHAVPKPSDDASNDSTLSVPGGGSSHGHTVAFAPLPPSFAPAPTGPKLLALRLLHLTERSSSVLLAATEKVEVLRRDTLMVVFQAFAKLNSIQVEPRMTLSTDPDDFAHSIYDEAIESGTGTIIFPWNSTSLPGMPNSSYNNMEEHFLGPNHPASLAKPQVTSNTQVISRLLQTTVKSSLTTAVFVDREFGGSGPFSNIMVALYGSLDDEEVLKLTSTMSHSRECKVIIVRVHAPKEEINEKGDVRVEFDAQSIDSEHEDAITAKLPEDNAVLVQEYFSHRAFADRRSTKKVTNNSNSARDGIHLGAELGDNIFVQDVPSIQDAIGLAKEVLGSRDLLVLGRGLIKKTKGRHSSAASTHTVDHHSHQQQQPIATSTGFQVHTTQVHTTQFTVGTPIHPIDSPLGDHSGNSQGGAHRSRHAVRTQLSSRDILHSSMIISNVLGIVAESYLNSELASCMLVVQSGKGHGYGPAVTPMDISRVASSVRSRQHSKDLSHGGSRLAIPSSLTSDRPLGFENENRSLNLPSLDGQQHVRIVESDERHG